MRKIFTVLFVFLFTILCSQFTAFAQAPSKMSYQAVIRDANNNLVANHGVGVRVNVLRGSATGTISYREIYNPNLLTNANGLVTVEIGTGIALIGSLDTINWANGPYFLSIETDPTGATNYTVIATSQFLSVPYALNAKTADSITGSIPEIDPVYAASQAANITANDITHLSNLSGVNTGDQDLTGITHNNRVALDAVLGVNTGDQDLSSYASKTLLADSITKVRNEKVSKVTGKDLVSNGTAVGQMLYWNGTAWLTVVPGSSGQLLTMVNGIPTWGVLQTAGTNEIQNSKTGRIWMDRNLGASQAATSATDAASYGDLYQWGRGTDGHQLRNSSTTGTLSSTDAPGNALFISIGGGGSHDWRSPQNNSLWQGVNGINNPCPTGFRIPTEAEFLAESSSWGGNSTGAFSTIKLSLGGFRYCSGSLSSVGAGGYYWTSTINGDYSQMFRTNTSYAGTELDYRGGGNSVRCIKN
ncbi:MAG: hypothetical protein WCK02_16815 [Bacteroidota bacterium]